MMKEAIPRSSATIPPVGVPCAANNPTCSVARRSGKDRRVQVHSPSHPRTNSSTRACCPGVPRLPMSLWPMSVVVTTVMR